jgi:hypothetical protein
LIFLIAFNYPHYTDIMSVKSRKIPKGTSACQHITAGKSCDLLIYGSKKFCDTHVGAHQATPGAANADEQAIFQDYQPNARQRDVARGLTSKHTFVNGIERSHAIFVLALPTQKRFLSTKGTIYKKIADGYCTCPQVECMCSGTCACNGPCSGACCIAPAETAAMQQYKNAPGRFAGTSDAFNTLGVAFGTTVKVKDIIYCVVVTTYQGTEALLITPDGKLFRKCDK